MDAGLLGECALEEGTRTRHSTTSSGSSGGGQWGTGGGDSLDARQRNEHRERESKGVDRDLKEAAVGTIATGELECRRLRNDTIASRHSILFPTGKF